jgi:hypothetical protein
MTERVTDRDLENVCHRINRIVNQTDNHDAWEANPDWNVETGTAGNALRARIGIYYIDGAYGGVALYRIMSEGGGVTDVFNVGHVPKRELRDLMFAYIEGLDAGMRAAETAAESVA